MKSNAEMRLKKAHVALMKAKETALYSGIFMMGKNSIEDGNFTAYTDGLNKKYCRSFVDKLSDEELRGIVLHENLHIAMKHLQRFKNEFMDNPMLTNASADYVVNDMIYSINNKKLVDLPEGRLYDAKFHNWSVKEVYDYLKKEMDSNKKNKDSQSGEKQYKTLDDHDFENAQSITEEQKEKLSQQIDKALRQGGMLAGRMGANVPRSILDLLEPKVDWKDVLRDFISNSTKGNDEYTWRRFNKRLMANDMYMPSVVNESVGELVVAIDTSGSIDSKILTEFASELVSICDVSTPSKIRVLWWDTAVHGEQIFEPDQYANISSMLKPEGGGGTMVSCVSEYINSNNVSAEAVIVFTDGYVENNIEWNIGVPTLWLVTENKNLQVPTGIVIRKEN